MAAIAIAQPKTIAGAMSGNSPIMQQPPLFEATTDVPIVGTSAVQSWLKSSLVQVTSDNGVNRLQRCASAATAIYGLAPQAALGTASLLPPASLFPPSAAGGQAQHWPFNLRDVLLEISITNGSASGANIGANGVTWAGGGTGGVELAPGQQYGLLTMTSGTYAGYQTLDVTNTTQKVFEIVQLAPQFGGVRQAITDNNPRVWVKIMPAALQA